MTGGKKPQGPAGPSEVWKELLPPGQMGPSALLPLATCEPCWSQPDPGQAAGLQSGACVSCHAPHPLSWARVAPGRPPAVVQGGRVCSGGGHGSEPRDWCLAPRSCVCGLGQLMSLL